ncbi:hypothetical protein COOONC_02882 [Cooperia oncophora]
MSEIWSVASSELQQAADEKINSSVNALHPIYSQLHKKAIPVNGQPGPLTVHVGFYVESLGNFRSTEMTFDMDVCMYIYELAGYKSIRDKIWLPDLYFANARTAYFHEVTVHNFNMFVSFEGVIAYRARVTLNLGKARSQNFQTDD